MNRPMIQGTESHKASIAKAKKESIVAQTRTEADKGLLSAADFYGKSFGPGEVDYTLEFPDIQIPKKKKKKQTLDERLAEAEKLADWEKEQEEGYYIEGVESKKSKKAESEDDKYKTMPLGPEHEEYAKQLKAKELARLKALKEAAAKKYNVKIEDLEAKEVKGTVGYFPKEGALGGPHVTTEKGDKGTQWSDELGRFKEPKAKILTPKEAKEMVKEMKPKFPSGVSKTSINEMIQSGELALNYEKNTYEYTTQYYDRMAKEKIAKEKKSKDRNIKTLSDKKSKTIDKNRRPKPEDYRWGKTGGWKYKGKEQYESDMEAWRKSKSDKKSPAEMRDDRIWRNARKGSPIHENMRKSGYIPPNER